MPGKRNGRCQGWYVLIDPQQPCKLSLPILNHIGRRRIPPFYQHILETACAHQERSHQRGIGIVTHPINPTDRSGGDSIRNIQDSHHKIVGGACACKRCPTIYWACSCSTEPKSAEKSSMIVGMLRIDKSADKKR